jgi:hypothetical protein
MLLAAACLAVAGCGTYRLDVVAVDSAVTDARFVSPDRVPAGATPLRDVRIELHRDPGSLGEELAADGRTDADGRAALRLDAFGAGWMVEQWRIEASAPGRESVMVLRRLPAADEGLILLVEMPSGAGPPPSRPSDPWEDYRRFR